MGDSNYNISFGGPYYQSVDYRTRHPAYLKHVVSPPKRAVNVEDLYPKKFGLRKRKEFQFTNYRVEDKLCPGRLDLQEAAVVVGTKVVVKNRPITVINRPETQGLMCMGGAVVDPLKNKRRHVKQKKLSWRTRPKTPAAAETLVTTETPVAVETPLPQMNATMSTNLGNESRPTENDVDDKTKVISNNGNDYRSPLYFPSSFSPPLYYHSSPPSSFPPLAPPPISLSISLAPLVPSSLPPPPADINPHQQHPSTQQIAEDHHCQFTESSLGRIPSSSRSPSPTPLVHITNTTTTTASTDDTAGIHDYSTDGEQIDPVQRFVKTAKMFAIECSRRRQIATGQGNKAQTLPVDDGRIKRMMTMAISTVAKRGYDYDDSGWKLKKTLGADDDTNQWWSERRWRNNGKAGSKYTELEQPGLDEFDGVAGRWALNSKGTIKGTDKNIVDKTPVVNCTAVVTSCYVDIVHMRVYL